MENPLVQTVTEQPEEEVVVPAPVSEPEVVVETPVKEAVPVKITFTNPSQEDILFERKVMALHDLCKKGLYDYSTSHPDKYAAQLPKMLLKSKEFLAESSVPSEIMALRKMKCV